MQTFHQQFKIIVLMVFCIYSITIYQSNIAQFDANPTLSSCNPTYFIFRKLISFNWDRVYIEKLSTYGFTEKCTNAEMRYFVAAEEILPNRSLCLKYDNKSPVHSNTFCNGGRVHFYEKHMNSHYHLNILSKTTLNHILTQYCDKYYKNTNICNFKPLSYNMENEQERIEFLTKHINCTNDDHESSTTWLFKENKNRGKGIHLVNNHQLIYKLISPNISEAYTYYPNCRNLQPIQNKKYFKTEGFNYYTKTQGFAVTRKGLLMQEFIDNPLLIEGGRFHLRSFLLVPSYSNPFIVLHYPKGVIYRNVEQYDMKKQTERNSVLTNHHISQVSDKVINNNFEWLWGYDKFQEYLDDNYGYKMKNYTMNKLNKDIKQIAKHIFNASLYNKKINGIKDNNNLYDNFNGNIDLKFDQYCMDILINDKFELKLMEVNFGCGPAKINAYCDRNNSKGYNDKGYDYACDVANDFGNETIDIVMEIYNKKSNHISIHSIDSLHNFEVIIFETNSQWK